MPNFLEDVSKQLNKTDFNKEFLGIFVRNGFGALPKREIELTLLELLMKYASKSVGSNSAVYNLARKLRLSPRRLPLCQGSCPLLYFSLFFRWAG